MIQFIVLFALATIVAANDLTVGLKDNGRKIFDEQRIASPAIWRQIANVSYHTSDNEVISGLVIKDLRPGKDGEAKIVEGGEGYKNVTIELKSPTVFRGYDFIIEVYAVSDDKELMSATDQSNLDANNKQDTQTVPILLSGDMLEDKLRRTRKTTDASSFTLNLPDASSTVPSVAITKVAIGQSTQRPHESLPKDIETPVNIEKDIPQAIDVPTTPKITSPLTSDASVRTNESEITKQNTNKSNTDEMTQILPIKNLTEKTRSTRNSEVPKGEEKDFSLVSTEFTNIEASTEFTSTVLSDTITTSESVTDTVTVVDSLEALASKNENITVPRNIISNDYKFKAPIPYNH